jgi:uncharacterized sulfatase
MKPQSKTSFAIARTLRVRAPFLTMLLGALSTVSLVAAEEKPNILIILSDDQGYCELGSTLDIATADNLGAPLAAKYRAIQASTDSEAPIAVCFAAARKCTPNLDALARQGVRFTQFYGAPTCSPARAALLTGRYPQSFGVYTNTDVVVDDKGVPPAVKFPVKVFQQAGYMTGVVGKWHLGSSQPGQHPNDRGFDYYFGFDIAVTPKYNSKRLVRNREKAEAVGWLADQTSAEAVAFLERSRQEQRPFFLYVAYNEPHGPTERPPQAYIDHFKSGSDVVDVHFATIYGMDQGIGRILGELKRTGRLANTLIFFASDNGIAQLYGFTGKKGNYHAPVPGAGPFRGGKWTPWEGGVRVPMIAYLPQGAIKTSSALASIIDVMPTALDYAAIPVPDGYRLDGRSLLPILKGESDGDAQRTLFWAADAQEPFGDFGPQHLALKDMLRANAKAQKEGRMKREEAIPPAWYVRTPQWKLIGWDALEPVLIDMVADPYEYKDVAAKHPEVVQRLRGQFHTWIEAQSPPQTYSRRLWEKLRPASAR